MNNQPKNNYETDEMIDFIFREILPSEDYNIREEQIRLTKKMCNSLNNHRVSLCEAEVGIGKTLSYIVACIVNSLYKPDDMRVRMNYSHSYHFTLNTNMPYIITTSSIELQKAILNDYIPNISNILLKYGIIDKPITAVLRKGKNNYICDKKLAQYYNDISASRPRKSELKAIEKLSFSDDCDLENAKINQYDKKHICVTSCPRNCDYKHVCRYNELKTSGFSPEIMFHVCNHHYFIADLINRDKGLRNVLPNYRGVIIDEAHKLDDSLKSLIKIEIDKDEIVYMLNKISTSFSYLEKDNILFEQVNKTLLQLSRLFDDFNKQIPISEGDKEYKVQFNKKDIINIKMLALCLNQLKQTISYENNNSRFIRILDRLRNKLIPFVLTKDYIYWISRNDCNQLNSLSINSSNLLIKHLWNKCIPVVLTSGTLAIGGNFNYFIDKLGMKKLQTQKLNTGCYQSPYDYKNNCLIYITENTVSPTKDDDKYIHSLADEILKLTNITKGRTLVLFTSYKTLNKAYEMIKDKTKYPLIISERSSKTAVQEFRQTKDGILLSADAWEGIDIKGELLSSIIISKLPFPTPDCTSIDDSIKFYDNLVTEIIPNMQIKLKQGAGRLIRSESDRGVICLLDHRANSNGKYRHAAINCLPNCNITNDYDDIIKFL